MNTGHPHAAVDGLIAADGSVRVPQHLTGPVRAVLLRWLAHAAADGAAPSADLRPLLWALDAAERRPATRPGSASGTPPPSSPIVEISTAAAATLLGSSSSYVRRLCRTGRIPARRSGRDWLIDQAGLDSWRHGITEAP